MVVLSGFRPLAIVAEKTLGLKNYIDNMLTELKNFLKDLRSLDAVIMKDLIDGASFHEIEGCLLKIKLNAFQELIAFWKIVGGTQQPIGTDPQLQEKYRLDSQYIYYSPSEACEQYQVIQSEKDRGFEDFSDLPNTCLPIACSIFGEFLCVEGDVSGSFYGHVFNFDPPTSEYKRVSTSLDNYFKTVRAAMKANIIKLDENLELDMEDYESYFAIGMKMNPKCDFWSS